MEELTSLHQKMEQDLIVKYGPTSDKVTEYLMNCMDYLMTGDLIGWKKRFAPEKQESSDAPSVKRRRGSPSYVWPTSLPACQGCKSQEVIEDVMGGSVVCTVCGMIQGPLLSTDAAHTSVERLQRIDRHVIHRYSRVVYFRSFLWSIQGFTRPVISSEDVARLRRLTNGSRTTPEDVVVALKKLKLATKYRRHKYSLAVLLSGNMYKPIQIEASDFFEMLRLFRRVEYHWEWSGGKKVVMKRRVFLSYPYVYYQLCYHMGVMHLTGKHHLLLSRVLLSRQHSIYKVVAEAGGLQCDVSVFR